MLIELDNKKKWQDHLERFKNHNVFVDPGDKIEEFDEDKKILEMKI